MARLNLTAGPLPPPDIAWRQNATVNVPNGTVVNHVSGSANPGVAVVKGGSNQFVAKPTTGNGWFATWSTPASLVAILTISDTTPGITSVRRVVIVDTGGSALVTKVDPTISV